MSTPGQSLGAVAARSGSGAKEMILMWVQNRIKHYPILMTNFSTCWNDGLAFCALIHVFYPENFDWYALKAENRRHNFTLGFEKAESLAGIYPLLEVEDMVRFKKPDWKCVFTYVQSFYRRFRDGRSPPKSGPTIPSHTGVALSAVALAVAESQEAENKGKKIVEQIRKDKPEKVEQIRKDIPETMEQIRKCKPEIMELIRKDKPEIMEQIRIVEPDIMDQIRKDTPEIVEQIRINTSEIFEKIRGNNQETSDLPSLKGSTDCCKTDKADKRNQISPTHLSKCVSGVSPTKSKTKPPPLQCPFTLETSISSPKLVTDPPTNTQMEEVDFSLFPPPEDQATPSNKSSSLSPTSLGPITSTSSKESWKTCRSKSVASDQHGVEDKPTTGRKYSFNHPLPSNPPPIVAFNIRQ